MSIPTDTFARFVDVVSASLDDATATSSHAERTSRASTWTGQSPRSRVSRRPRFRRRIRLERAAHELVSTDDGVLEIALRAGYTTNEAFTRAFTRAYGRTPSDWRSQPPPTIHLPAPSGVHFHPHGGLTVPARGKVTTMDLFQRSSSGTTSGSSARSSTGSSASTNPTSSLPITISVEYIDDDPTLRSAVSRLIGQLAMWNAVVAGRAYDFGIERDETIESMRNRLAEARPVS